MDVGKFKVNRVRLILWLAIPPALALGLGLSTYALRLRSEWKLSLTSKLATVLPSLVYTQEKARDLLVDFQNSPSREIQSEDQMISFLQDASQRTGFTVDSLKVDRRRSPLNSDMSLLKAQIIGLGRLEAIEQFMHEVSDGQYLLSEKMLKISKSASSFDSDLFQTEMELELLLFNSVTGAGGHN